MRSQSLCCKGVGFGWWDLSCYSQTVDQMYRIKSVLHFHVCVIVVEATLCSLQIQNLPFKSVKILMTWHESSLFICLSRVMMCQCFWVMELKWAMVSCDRFIRLISSFLILFKKITQESHFTGQMSDQVSGLRKWCDECNLTQNLFKCLNVNLFNNSQTY